MSDDLPVLDLRLIATGEGVTLDFTDEWRTIFAPFQKLVDEGKARWPDAPPLPSHWLAVVSVSWQDCADDLRPQVIPEAINRPVKTSEIVVLFDGSDGDDRPMIALGRVTKIDVDRGLIDFWRVTPIFSPEDP